MINIETEIAIFIDCLTLAKELHKYKNYIHCKKLVKDVPFNDLWVKITGNPVRILNKSSPVNAGSISMTIFH